MIEITEGFDLTRMTTFGLTVECGRLIEYDTADDLKQLQARGELRGVLPIGGGSNLLFTSARFDGTVLHNRSKAVSFEDRDDSVICHAAAGVTLDDLCRITAEQGLWGMENLSGIPGEMGGAAVQNVGAYGTEFKDLAFEVHCFDTVAGEERTLTAADCRYGYRDSKFKHLKTPSQLIVYAVTLVLSRTKGPNMEYAALKNLFPDTENLTPMMMRNAVIGLRDAKLPSPSKVGSAGSFFKNPVVSAELFDAIRQKANKPVSAHVMQTGEVKISAAWLIDNAGCKPLTAGGAALWQQQPLVLVNATGHATSADVLTLEKAVIERVRNRFGIELTPEVIHI